VKSIFYFLVVFALAGCSDSDKIIKISGNTMGTTYHIVVITSEEQGASINPKKLKQQIDNLLKIVNQQMSTYQQDSEISRFNHYQKTDWFNVSRDFAFVVANAQKVSQLTQGAFDITISSLVDLWGFGAKTKYTIPSEKQISALLAHTGYQHLDVQDQPASLKKNHSDLNINLSAIAKGFAVDKVSLYLSKKGFKRYLIEIGGEIKASGKNAQNKDWQIAIEQPDQHNSIVRKTKKTLSLSNEGLATSGDYRNYYIKDGVRFSHTINPKTGKPIKHKLASVTIFNESTMIADAYATAVMVMGGKEGKVFIIKNKIKAYMIFRENDSFTIWSNLLP